jgi:CheY-like chemotaxis protein
VPILALTALTGSVVKRRSQEAGMTTVIEKPVNPLKWTLEMGPGA